jgi:hypothetical protein
MICTLEDVMMEDFSSSLLFEVEKEEFFPSDIWINVLLLSDLMEILTFGFTSHRNYNLALYYSKR